MGSLVATSVVRDPLVLALGHPTLLEEGFPFADVSALALADRHSKDATYSAHKWWARRPPAVIRALLLAAALPAGTSRATFWDRYREDRPWLDGHHVGDPFMGGATTAVEASRLGAAVTGIDVDPLAVSIAQQQLEGVDKRALDVASRQLLEHLDTEVGTLFHNGQGTDVPLHYFFLRRIECPGCHDSQLLYRTPILARDIGRAGGVVRDTDVVAVCPDCIRVHQLSAGEALHCCGRDWPLDQGTFDRGRFTCTNCSQRASHDAIQTARQPRVLVGVEETTAGRRRIRGPRPDEDGAAAARAWWSTRDLVTPAARLGSGETRRARNYGFERVRDLFSSRQAAFFASAFAHIEHADIDDGVRRALRLATSNALAANNLLCGYATDYGRIAPLFTGVRAYSIPVLSVELNPLHRSAGRATLAATLRRIARTAAATVRRHTFDPTGGQTESHAFAARRSTATTIMCRSADRGFPAAPGTLTLAVSDPPYFDYISYSDLSLFFRAWHRSDGRAEQLGGTPIYPTGPDAAQEFEVRLARAFANLRAAMRTGALFCFTFHATEAEAWQALGGALRESGFMPVTVFPVWSDGRAASHSHAGNCEWDLVFVCRARDENGQVMLPESIAPWLDHLDDFTVSPADRESMMRGLQCAHNVVRAEAT